MSKVAKRPKRKRTLNKDHQCGKLSIDHEQRRYLFSNTQIIPQTLCHIFGFVTDKFREAEEQLTKVKIKCDPRSLKICRDESLIFRKEFIKTLLKNL